MPISPALFAFLMLTCRLVAGGALVVAGLIKVTNPRAVMLSIQGYELVPETLIPFLAYALPWSELAIGALLLYGFWSREAATLAAALYGVFTIAVISVLVRDMPLDCGCFGGMFGETAMDWTTVARNLILLGFTAAILWKGPGPLALDAVMTSAGESEPRIPLGATIEAARERVT